MCGEGGNFACISDEPVAGSSDSSAEGECTQSTGKLSKHTVLISEECCPDWQHVLCVDMSEAQVSRLVRCPVLKLTVCVVCVCMQVHAIFLVYSGRATQIYWNPFDCIITEGREI